jgi:hypothetical protein
MDSTREGCVAFLSKVDMQLEAIGENSAGRDPEGEALTRISHGAEEKAAVPCY